MQDSTISLKLDKVEQTFNNYTSNRHAGLTLITGHPFIDPALCQEVKKVQKAIHAVFETHAMGDLMCDTNKQLHATLIELATQHNSDRNDQSLLDTHELSISA